MNSSKRSVCQKSFRDNKKRLKRKATKEGEKFAVLKDTVKKHCNGTPVTQLFWKDTVLTVLGAELATV